jgi:hypothetical protein
MLHDDTPYGKPIWIGQIINDMILSAEHEIGATEIVFPGFGRYTFERSRRDRRKKPE